MIDHRGILACAGGWCQLGRSGERSPFDFAPFEARGKQGRLSTADRQQRWPRAGGSVRTSDWQAAENKERSLPNKRVPMGAGGGCPAIGTVTFWNFLTLGPVYEYASSVHKGNWGPGCSRAEEGAMLRKRLLILLSGCFLMTSAAWADDVGYVDCANHSDDLQVFAKSSKTPDIVATIPCGERFTVLIYGFVFSRVQTRDGKIGFVYSNLIAVDRTGTVALRPASERVPVPRSNAAVTTAAAARPSPAAAIQPPPPAVAQTAPAPVAAAPVTPAEVVLSSSAAAPAATSSVPATSETAAQANSVAPAQPQSATVAMAPAALAPVAPESMASAAPAPAVEPAPSVKETMAPAAPASPASVSRPQPEPATDSRPQPAPAEAVAPVARDASVRSSWEKPNPGARRRAPLLELFGGYAFARFDSGGGTTSNLNGGMGSFGWNIKPWLQLTADSSYNFVTISGTKSVLYGNHFGARYFHRARNRWGLTPFAEGLVGGSRLDTSLVGVPGYASSSNCISFKVGGGLDIHPSRHFDIRLFDVDYYRTSFGTNAHQTNYWASTGIVIRLFGGGAE